MARWYIIHAYSGFEGKVRDAIMSEATRLGLDRLVEQIEVPTETVTEARPRQEDRGGAQVHARLRAGQARHDRPGLPPGEEHPQGNRLPGRDGKAAGDQRGRSRADAQLQGGSRRRAKQKIKVDYEIGDAVKVLEGPFASFNGTVEMLDFDKAKVKVSVSIFGRATPVELDFEQVERSK